MISLARCCCGGVFLSKTLTPLPIVSINRYFSKDAGNRAGRQGLKGDGTNWTPVEWDDILGDALVRPRVDEVFDGIEEYEANESRMSSRGPLREEDVTRLLKAGMKEGEAIARGRGFADGDTNKEFFMQHFVCETITYRRVSNVTSGSSRGEQKLSALLVCGNREGVIGYGVAKAKNWMDARQKAVMDASRNLFVFPVYDGRTLVHPVTAHSRATKVEIWPAPAGTGLVCNQTMKSILRCGGIRDAVAKAHGSYNPFTVVEATFRALCSSESLEEIARKRGKKVMDIVDIRARQEKHIASKIHGEKPWVKF